MSTRYDLVAREIAAALNNAPPGTFREAFDAKARYVVSWKLTDLQNAVKVSVTPRSADRSIESRSTDRVEMPLDVAVQTRCTATDTDRVAELVELTDQIEAYLNRLNLEADAVAALWKGSEIDPLYDAAMLHHDRVFTSVLTLTYAVFVDRREPVGGGA